MLDGTVVGTLDVGYAVGGFVSPGTVGLEVVGDFEGREVGADDVGIEVGALIILV